MMQLGEALFSKSRRAVLSILYGQPDRAFYLREIADKAVSAWARFSVS